jgi:hypothetical protein
MFRNEDIVLLVVSGQLFTSELCTWCLVLGALCFDVSSKLSYFDKAELVGSDIKVQSTKYKVRVNGQYELQLTTNYEQLTS